MNNANSLVQVNHIGGRFAPGNNANPLGAGARQGMHVRGLAREWTDKAIKRLGAALDGPDSTAIRAAEILLERAWGKPVQPVDLTVISLEDLDQLIAELTERLASQAIDVTNQTNQLESTIGNECLNEASPDPTAG